MLTPSLMYEHVHTLHHARTRYGTADDPEYMPLALMKPWTLPVFVLVAALAPLALLVRFAILTPLGALVPAIRRFSWERFSALAINPAFRRRPAEGAMRRRFFWMEAGASAWSMVLLVESVAARMAPFARCAGRIFRRRCVQPIAHTGRAFVGKRWRADDGDSAISGLGECSAALAAGRVLGAGGPALSRAASPDPQHAISFASRSPSAHFRASGYRQHFWRGQPQRADAAGGQDRAQLNGRTHGRLAARFSPCFRAFPAPDWARAALALYQAQYLRVRGSVRRQQLARAPAQPRRTGKRRRAPYQK